MANVLALPSLDKLYNLERLQVLSMPSLRTLPPLDNLVKLRALTITDRGEVCCNGYLGNCDLTKPACSYSRLWQMPAVAQCVGVDEVATPATKAAFNKFRDSICQYVLDRTQAEGSPTLNEMLQCNGTMYRQCDVPDYGVGMCYNSRWLPVACRPSRFAVAMRRQQIALKIGEPCDPEVEAWLGC